MKQTDFCRQRPLAVGSCLFAIGLWAGFQGALTVPVWAGLLLFSLLIALLCRKQSGRVLYAVLACAFFAGGVYMAALESVPQIPDGMYDVSGYVTGSVSVREEDGYTQTYIKKAVLRDESGRTFRAGKMYWVMTAEDEDLALVRAMQDGDRVRFRGKVQTPLGRMNPYGYDFRLYLLQQGVRYRVSGMADLAVGADSRLDFEGVMFRVRTAIGWHMEKVFGDSAYFPKALLIGDKDEMPKETKEAFSDLGIAHVLTVSGLHVALLTGMVMGTLKKLYLSPRMRLWVQAVILFFYCALLGFSVPVVRASLLLLLYAYRRYVRRNGDPLTLLAAVFGVILLFSPYSLFSLSFQMTFGAVLGMVLFRTSIRKRLDFLPVWLMRLGPDTCLAATVGVAIPLINAFHRFSLVGILFSPLAVIGMSALLPVMLLIALAGAVYLPAGQWLGKGFSFLFGRLTEGISLIAQMPFASVRVPAVPWMLALAVIYILFLCTRYTLMPVKRRLAAGAVALMAAFGLFKLTESRDVCYIQLYQGQADAAVVLDEDFTLAVDTGTSGSDMADLLLSLGRDVDVLVLTHLHSDHAGGVMDLLDERVPIGQVLIPKLGEMQQIDEEGAQALALLREKGIPITEVGVGDTVTLPSGQLEFLWPVCPRSGQDPNMYCLTGLLTIQDVRFLLMGDLPSTYENYVAQQADILKVAHHGSADGTSDDFLAKVQPKLALVTCAALRTLPNDGTVMRIQNAGSRILRTDETGAVTVYVNNGRYAVKTYLDQRK